LTGFVLALPNFISECGFGGIRKSAPMRRFVSSRVFVEDDMAESGLDNDYKLALGELVIETSKLESTLTEVIAALARIDLIDALVLVHPAPFAQKLDMLTALYRMMYPDEKAPSYASIKAMLGIIKDVSDFRNSVVHALWRVEDGIPQAIRFQRRGKLTRSEVPAPIEKIRQCTREARETTGELMSLARSYRELARRGPQSEE
jgi:hypothetical protein